MYKILLVTIIIILFPVIGMSQSTKVLFIGNSYTGVNNLPQLTYDMALSTGDTLIIDNHTPGGQRLLDHAANPQAIAKIFSNDWNYVVLQAQSQEPSWPIQQVQNEVFKPAKLLCDTIRANNSCSMPVFYMTWGRKNGDAFNCPNWPPVCTYDGMDSLLNERYQTMGEDNDAFVSPVGAVWHYIRDNYPGIELYSADESHPSFEGSYAAACTFYTIFLRKDPTLISFFGPIDPVMAEDIQASVKAVVFDSLINWNVGEFDPVADFDADSVTNVSGVNFTNQSINADSFYWDFGDGDTSSAENPLHYFLPGNYTITLIASKCGVTDTVTKTINVIIGSVNEFKQGLGIDVYPNPTIGLVNVVSVEGVRIQRILIFDAYGKEVLNISGNDRLDLSELSNALYWVKVETLDSGYSLHPIIKK